MKGDANKDPMWAFFEECLKAYDPDEVERGLREFMAESKAYEAKRGGAQSTGEEKKTL